MFQRILETLDHVLVQLLQKSKNILTMMKRYGIISRMKIDFKMADLKAIKKVTPKGDLSWYIKWTSSFIILIGMVLTSITGLEPYNLMFHFVGVLGWGIVGMLWHDRALIFINSIAMFIFAVGIGNYYVG